jgi:hypothetical protein
MHNFLRLAEDERKTVFLNSAQKMGMREAVIEKDFWVCLMLDYLFHKSQYKEHLAFKGGTSLSKCFNLIKRFSEDIDLILDWRVLGYSVNEPWAGRSNTKQDRFNKEVIAKSEDFIAEKFLPSLAMDLSIITGEKAVAVMDDQHSQTINFRYPRLFDTDTILPIIRLEIGALAMWTPTVEKDVVPYIFEVYPAIAQQKATKIRTSSAERTFWDKATILHHEANRPADSPMPLRYSRHYYDLYCLASCEYRNDALKQSNLMADVVRFKQKFYPRAWANYADAMNGAIKLIPPDYRMKALRDDYEKMREMFFGDYPAFDEMLTVLSDLEKAISQRRHTL